MSFIDYRMERKKRFSLLTGLYLGVFTLCSGFLIQSESDPGSPAGGAGVSGKLCTLRVRERKGTFPVFQPGQLLGPPSDDHQGQPGQICDRDHRKLIHKGPAAYSCLKVLPNGKIGLFYEAGEKDPYERMEFVSVDPDELFN